LFLYERTRINNSTYITIAISSGSITITVNDALQAINNGVLNGNTLSPQDIQVIAKELLNVSYPLVDLATLYFFNISETSNYLDA